MQSGCHQQLEPTPKHPHRIKRHSFRIHHRRKPRIGHHVFIDAIITLLSGGELGVMHKSLSSDVQPSAADWRVCTPLCAGGRILLAVQDQLPLGFILPAVVGAFGNYWSAAIHPDLDTRIYVATAVCPVLLFMAARTLYSRRHVAQWRSSDLLSFIFAVVGVFMIVRRISVALRPNRDKTCSQQAISSTRSHQWR